MKVVGVIVTAEGLIGVVALIGIVALIRVVALSGIVALTGIVTLTGIVALAGVKALIGHIARLRTVAAEGAFCGDAVGTDIRAGVECEDIVENDCQKEQSKAEASGFSEGSCKPEYEHDAVNDIYEGNQ